MARANAAYYATHDPFADFTTSPEIAQVFGELLGAWAAVVWASLGAPAPVHLIEAGPGRGTLMQDALRAIARVAPDFGAALRVRLIETSPRLRAAQASRLGSALWHDDLAAVPSGPAILLANEFLDALPIRQFARRASGWCERFVADGRFVEKPAPAFRPGVVSDPIGSIIETSDAIGDWSAGLAARLVKDGGAALILDYGPTVSMPGDSLQALRNGAPADPLADAGSADLTAHVDFAAIAGIAHRAGAAVWGPVPQGEFLGRLGLRMRTARLAAANPARAAELQEAAARLAAPARMGCLFKAMCLSDPAMPEPPGFG